MPDRRKAIHETSYSILPGFCAIHYATLHGSTRVLQYLLEFEVMCKTESNITIHGV